nr:hypothetical protein [Vibrio metschnikovii]
MMDDIHEQLGVNKSFLNETFAMIRISKEGEIHHHRPKAWHRIQDLGELFHKGIKICVCIDVLTL